MKPSPVIGRSLRRPGLNGPAILLGCATLVFVCLFPFLWMGLSSIKQLNELYTIPPQWWPDHPTLSNYYKVLFESRIPRYFLNSIIISVGSTGLALILAVFAANGFARFRFRGRSFWQACILVGQLLPTAAIISARISAMVSGRGQRHLRSIKVTNGLKTSAKTKAKKTGRKISDKR